MCIRDSQTPGAETPLASGTNDQHIVRQQPAINDDDQFSQAEHELICLYNIVK